MSDSLLQRVERQLDTLIQRCAHLEQENARLKAEQATWDQERTRLMEKNNLARERVEAMITHLKNLEAES